MLKVSNLTKKVNNTLLVNNVSFSINKGEILGLLGPNGAGKTTIMKMILGLTSKSNGTILINNKNLESQFELAITDVGAIIETPKFYPFLSGYENLKYFSSLNNFKDDPKIIKEVLEVLDLSKDAKKKVKHYSLGMRQKLGIAQATINKPSLLILDEPFNGLDPYALKKIRQYIKKLSLNGTSVLISSHIISEIELLCDNIIVLKKGEFIGGFKVDETSIDSSVLVNIDVDNLEKTIHLIYKNFNLICCIDKKSIHIKIKKDNIPIILKKLLNEGINVYEIVHKRTSLEDKFIEITGGEIIA